MLDLTKYKFQEPAMMLSVDPELLKEARERGFYNGYTPFNDLFSNLFFSGGHINFREDVDEAFLQEAFDYMRSFMQTWDCKHQEKEAVCAMILSEIAVVVEEES